MDATDLHGTLRDACGCANKADDEAHSKSNGQGKPVDSAPRRRRFRYIQSLSGYNMTQPLRGCSSQERQQGALAYRPSTGRKAIWVELSNRWRDASGTGMLIEEKGTLCLPLKTWGRMKAGI
jgi:hypothetical protein